MTLVVDKYYRKISENSNNIKMKFDISSLLVKSKEHDNKIENIYDKDYIDNNFLVKSEIDKKDNNILNKINDHFYSRSYINDNYLIKGNTYDKKYIDDNYLIESEINKKDNNILNKINDHIQDVKNNYLIESEIDKKDNNILNKINDHIQDVKNNYLIESEIDKKDNNILNKINDHIQDVKNNYLIKGNTYDKKYIDDNYFTKKILNSSFASFYARIDLKDKEVLEKIENNYYNRTYLDNMFDNIYNKSEINEKTSKLDRNIVLFNTNLTKFIDETYKNDKKLLEEDINENKIKVDKMRYYIKEFIPFNITLVRKFNFIGNTNEIMILQFEMDQRLFDIDDMFQFFLNITTQFDNSKNNWYKIKLRLDILYDDDTLIKSFMKIPISKGFLYRHLMNFNINRFFKLSKKTEKIIFKIYICKVNTALVDDFSFNLNQTYEEDYCDIIHYKIV